MSNFLIEGPGGIPQIKIQGGYNSKLPITTTGKVTAGSQSVAGISTSAAPVLGSAPTVTFTPSSMVTIHTPTQSETINFSAATVANAGVEIFLEILTSGSSSFTLTFGTNTKTTGTLATGTTTAKIFLIDFVSDGTNWVEVSRTTAI